MRTLALHIECLRQLERERRARGWRSRWGIAAGTALVLLAIAGSVALERVARDRIGG